MGQTFNVEIKGTYITEDDAEADVTTSDVHDELKDALDSTDVEISGIEVEPEDEDEDDTVTVMGTFNVTEITVTEA